MDRETLEQALIARHGAENQKKFAAASVGVAGLGGPHRRPPGPAGGGAAGAGRL